MDALFASVLSFNDDYLWCCYRTQTLGWVTVQVGRAECCASIIETQDALEHRTPATTHA